MQCCVKSYSGLRYFFHALHRRHRHRDIDVDIDSNVHLDLDIDIGVRIDVDVRQASSYEEKYYNLQDSWTAVYERFDTP